MKLIIYALFLLPLPILAQLGVDDEIRGLLKAGVKIVRIDQLQKRGPSTNQLVFIPNHDAPFTGRAMEFHFNKQRKEDHHYKEGKIVLVTKWHHNGQKTKVENYKDGKFHGKVTWWYTNGQKRQEVTWKDGVQTGLTTSWYLNGQKSMEGNTKDDKFEGPATKWYTNGQKSAEMNFKDSKQLTTVAWKPNGEKCPVTNVKDGNGVWVFYKDDGTEMGRRMVKDGKVIYD